MVNRPEFRFILSHLLRGGHWPNDLPSDSEHPPNGDCIYSSRLHSSTVKHITHYVLYLLGISFLNLLKFYKIEELYSLADMSAKSNVNGKMQPKNQWLRTESLICSLETKLKKMPNIYGFIFLGKKCAQ